VVESIYTYSVSGDTLDGTVLASCLKDEINAEGGISETCTLIQVGVSADDNIDITMSDAVDAGEKTLLDSIVAAHSEVNCPGGIEGVGFGGESWNYNGGVVEIEVSKHHQAAWGNRKVRQGVISLHSGEVVGFSVAYDETITTGSMDCYVMINTVAQNGADQGITLNNINGGVGSLELLSPIPYTANSIIGATLSTDASFAPDGSSLSVTIYTRDT
jgi:hypothetical protein